LIIRDIPCLPAVADDPRLKILLTDPFVSLVDFVRAGLIDYP
jgi:hypothetical protein